MVARRLSACSLPSMQITERWGPQNLQEAAKALRANQVIGFPTETVYGLGGNALSDEAVSRIFDAKGRPSDNPLIVHVADLSSVFELIDAGDSNLRTHIERLSAAFWPGPLTLVLKQRRGCGLSSLTTAGLDSVGVRIPSHQLALQLLHEANVPVAAPSANTSGKPSPTTAAHVLNDLDGRVAGVLDGGPTDVGVESTVLDMSSGLPYTVLRPGGVTQRQLQQCIGDDLVRHADRCDVDLQGAPRAPGMKYAHYAPSAPLFFVSGTASTLLEHVRARVRAGERVGILSPLCVGEILRDLPGESVKMILCGAENDSALVARDLYSCLRRFDSDSDNVDSILCFGFSGSGIGEAVLNRLLKASQRVIETAASKQHA